MARDRNVVFIGIDAVRPELITSWADAGVLPNLQALMARGLSGRTTSLPGTFVGSTWSSFYTGVNPAKHGVHSLQQIRPGSYELYPCFAGEYVKREPFWNHLSRAGRRVAVLDVPLSALSKDINGIQLVEYGGHDAHYGFLASPTSLASELEARFGPASSHPVNGTCDANRSPAEFAAFRDALLDGVTRKTALTKHLMEQERWDFFAQVFTEGHCAGHQCWHLHDPSHKAHDAEAAREIGDPIRDVYVAIDAAIGELLAVIDDQTTVVVLASHGMGPTNLPYAFLRAILKRLKVAGAATGKAGPQARARKLHPLMRWIWSHSPETVRNRMLPSGRRYRHWVDAVHTGMCFAMHDTPSHSAVRVNLVGREPSGKIHPGEEFEEFCAELTRDLLSIVNVATGNPVVQRVVRTAEHYQGEYLDHLPDLFVEWNQEERISAIRSDKIGTMPVDFSHPRTGHHRIGGLFIAAGPSVEAGALDRTVSIMDFAPTVAGLLGVTLPDVDGEPIRELWDPGRSSR